MPPAGSHSVLFLLPGSQDHAGFFPSTLRKHLPPVFQGPSW
jgi:hypothetical protein